MIKLGISVGGDPSSLLMHMPQARLSFQVCVMASEDIQLWKMKEVEIVV
jgi:hypothetical protein